MAYLAEGPNSPKFQGAKEVKLTTLGYGYITSEEEVRENGCPGSRVEAERKPQRERERPTSWNGLAPSRTRGVTFGKDADVGGLATEASDSSQGAVPKDRDAILRAARVSGGEAGREKARVDLVRCKSALRELEGFLFPTVESDLGEGKNEVELERQDEAKSSPENSDSEEGAVGGASKSELSGEPPILGKKKDTKARGTAEDEVESARGTAAEGHHSEKKAIAVDTSPEKTEIREGAPTSARRNNHTTGCLGRAS